LSIQEKRWYLPEKKLEIVQRMQGELPGLSPIVVQILVNRGVESGQEAEAFLSTDLTSLHSPLLLKDMEKAVARIEQAIQQRERILVYGDYDVDGITSTTLLVSVLQSLGGLVEYYLPHRLAEGYGLNKTALTEAKERGIGLIITVDCGISAQEEIEHAKNINLDVIITDHHHPGEVLPEALAVINPKREDCIYPFKELAGVGVAYKLAEALINHYSLENKLEMLASFRELVAIGTIADIVPIVYENRVLVKWGLEALHKTNRIGIQALKEIAGIDDREFSPHTIGFVIGPRLNALGRLCSDDLPVDVPNAAYLGVKLLSTTCREEALKIAGFLDQENKRRQLLESQITQMALEMIEKEWNPAKEKVIVLGGEDWHLGVIGIVASRLLERYYRPVILLNFKGELAKGSARSIKGFHLFHALGKCEDLLERYGGHELAAGLTVTRDNLPAFRERINLLADELLHEEDLIPSLPVDVDGVDLDNLSFELLEQLEALAPYGCENSQPVLVCRDSKLLEYRPVGSTNSHLKLKAATGRASIDGIAFGLGAYSTELSTQQAYDLLFSLEKNEWKGRTCLQLRVQDLKPSKLSLPLIKKPTNNQVKEEIYYTEVIGSQGRERQKVVSQLQRGQVLRLQLDQEKTTSKAIKVETRDGELLGFLNNRISKRIGAYLKADLPCWAWVVLVNQSDDCCNLKIAITSLGQNLDNQVKRELPSDFYNNLQKIDDALLTVIRKNLKNGNKVILVYPSSLESLSAYQKLLAVLSNEGRALLAQADGGMSLLAVGKILAQWSADRISLLLVSKEFYLDYQNLLQSLSNQRVEVQKVDYSLSEEEFLELKSHWQQLVPSRDFLASLYRILKTQIPQNYWEKNVFINLRIEEISRILQTQGLEGSTSSQILAGLDILEEMNLLERELEGDKQYIYRLPIPKSKFNLGNLLRYREDLRIKERSAKRK